MLSFFTIGLFASAYVAAFPPFGPPPTGPKGHSGGWNLKQFNSLVTFGDSYTDESGLGYLIGHNGTAPPAGTLLPESFSTPGGGRTWDR